MLGPERNFILGAGEQFVEMVLPPPRMPSERAPYTPEEARQRLAPRLLRTVDAFRRMPSEALPDGEAVAELTLHPQFLSKSAFPSELLSAAELRTVGSKPAHVTPDKVARSTAPTEEATTVLFVAGRVEAFDRLSAQIGDANVRLESEVADGLGAVEEFRAMMPSDRWSPGTNMATTGVLECVLHAGPGNHDARVVDAFERYAESLGLKVDRGQRLFASGLCFMAVAGDVQAAQELAWFAFLRRIRAMPRMRPLLPTRITRSNDTSAAVLPDCDALAPGVVAAVFDTSLPADHALARWVSHYSHGVPDYTDPEERNHGLCVASAAVLGPLDNLAGGVPPFRVDHHAVLGEDPDQRGYHAALKTIQKQVRQNGYRLFNLSFGPDVAIEDDDVNPFTAVVDDLLSAGDRLAFVAVGNYGDLDDALQLNRIQPPADAVNAVSVGASDTRASAWQRADYSCVGPGRPGCRVKPDLVAFGGSRNEPFGCIGPGAAPQRYDTAGTSFASPYTMRIAGAVMAAMGEQVTPLAVKALLIHGCALEGRARRDVGNGLVPTDLARLLSSDGDEVKVLYQGHLPAGKYVQHTIPMLDDLRGMVQLDATLCYATSTEPHYPASYVQAGVEATFRPHSGKHASRTTAKGGLTMSTSAKSSPLFSQSNVYDEPAGRRDAHRWDTVLRAQRNMRATSLKDPTIELHCSRRVGGRNAGPADQHPVPYALVLTVRCRAVADLYNQVRARYGANLIVLTPRLQVPVRI